MWPGLSALAGNRRLNADIAKGGTGQAIVLAGPAGSGRKTAARLLAAASVCSGEGAKPCGVCKHCIKAAAGIHPDIITIEKAGKSDFKVEQARELRKDAYIYPNEAARKVYIIPDGQDMNDHAQNALLKVLEEPPDYARFIMITDQKESILSTVLSRCMVWNMEPLSREEGLALLKEYAPEAPENELEEAFFESDGYAGAAITRLGKEPQAAAAAARTFAAAVARGQELGIFRASSAAEKLPKEEYLIFLNRLGEIIRGAAVYKTGQGDKFVLAEEAALAGKLTMSNLASLSGLISKHVDWQRFNVRPSTSATALVAETMELLSR